MSFPSNIALNNLFYCNPPTFVRAVCFTRSMCLPHSPTFTIGPSIAFTYRPGFIPPINNVMLMDHGAMARKVKNGRKFFFNKNAIFSVNIFTPFSFSLSLLLSRSCSLAVHTKSGKQIFIVIAAAPICLLSSRKMSEERRESGRKMKVTVESNDVSNQFMRCLITHAMCKCTTFLLLTTKTFLQVAAFPKTSSSPRRFRLMSFDARFMMSSW